MPKAFIENIILIRTGTDQYKIINNWTGPYGEPFNIWFERGTKKNYLIEPKVKQPFGGHRGGRSQEPIAHGLKPKRKPVKHAFRPSKVKYYHQAVPWRHSGKKKKETTLEDVTKKLPERRSKKWQRKR